MMEAIREILGRELGKLRAEVVAYASDDAVWREAPGISNPGGTLVLHLTSNLRHFIGAILGGTGFVRDRDAEFTTRGTPRAELLAMIDRAAADVDATLARLDDGVMGKPYPVPVLGRENTMAFFLVHLTQHFTYHLGQVNYHRRLVGSTA
jgi:uncharacterized damage-inducible protein DinB